MRTVAVVLPNIAAPFTVDDIGGAHHGVTDASGYGTVSLSELTITRVTVNADGYQPYAAEGVQVPPHDNFQIRIGVPRDPSRPQDVILPALSPLAPPSPHLSIRGRDFVDASGQIVKVNGVDGFLDFRLFIDGGEAALEPFIQETLDCGFNARRVFLQGSISKNQVMQLDPKQEPDYYNRVRPYVELMNGRGIIPILTIGIDDEDICSPAEHWARIDELTKGTDRIISHYNERDKNVGPTNPDSIAPMSGLWSRGSLTSNLPPIRPCGPILEFHPVRNYPTAMRDAIASPIELYEVQGYQGPLIIDEPGRMGTNPHDERFSDPRTVYEYARALSVLCAGAVNHNYFGQRGQLMDDLTRECALAWSKGMGR